MELHEKIKNLRKSKRMTQVEVANQLKVSRSAYNMWERGERRPSIPVLRAIASLYNIDVMELLQIIFDEKNGEEKIKENIIEYEAKEKQPNILRVPVLGSIPAGHPVLAEENIDTYIDLPNVWNFTDPEKVFVLTVKGDSMTGARIYSGDRVVVKFCPEVDNNDIAVVNVNGDEATLKRVKITEDGKYYLLPENPNYNPILIENEKARIIGKVIQVMFDPK